MPRHGIVQSMAVGTTPVMILGTDARRRAILLSPPLSPTDSLTVSTERDVVSGAGLILAPGGQAITITREHFGDAITRPWFAVSSAGSLTLGLLVAVGDDSGDDR